MLTAPETSASATTTSPLPPCVLAVCHRVFFPLVLGLPPSRDRLCVPYTVSLLSGRENENVRGLHLHTQGTARSLWVLPFEVLKTEPAAPLGPRRQQDPERQVLGRVVGGWGTALWPWLARVGPQRPLPLSHPAGLSVQILFWVTVLQSQVCPQGPAWSPLAPHTGPCPAPTVSGGHPASGDGEQAPEGHMLGTSGTPTARV